MRMTTNGRGIVTTVILLSFLLVFSQLVAAAPAEKMSVQGRLTNTTDGSSLTGTYSINFSLWNNPSAGTMQYNETLSVTTDSNGLYSVVLTPTDESIFSAPLWMALKIESDAEMSPRMNLTTSPYAYQSLDLQCTNCIGPTEINDSYVLLTGDQMAGTLDMNTNIITNIGNAGTDFIASTGGLNLAGTLTVVGAGTHTIAGTLNVASNGLFANSSHVGIGTASPGYKLELSDIHDIGILIAADADTSGDDDAFIRLSTDGGSPYFDLRHIDTASTNRFEIISSNSGTIMTFDDVTGEVGIGTSDPNESLHVYGGIINVSGAGADICVDGDKCLSDAASDGSLVNGRACYTTGSDVDCDDVLYWDSESDYLGVGIDPSYNLHAAGTINLSYFYVESDGDVGIGETSPSEALEVKGNISLGTPGSGFSRRIYVEQSSANDGADLYVASGDANAPSGSLGGDLYIDGGAGNGAGAKGDIILQTQAASGIDGYVGIGTTDPNSTLHVVGDINVTGTGNCIYLPGGGKLCGNTTCIFLTSPDGGTIVEACN